jgi:hypothetical protein
MSSVGCRSSTDVGCRSIVVVVAHVEDAEEDVDVREEVVVRELVVGLRLVASSRA